MVADIKWLVAELSTVAGGDRWWPMKLMSVGGGIKSNTMPKASDIGGHGRITVQNLNQKEKL